MFGLADLAWLGGALVAAWGMYEYLPGLLQRGLRRATPQISAWHEGADVTLVDYGEAPPARLPETPAQPGAMPTDVWRDALNESPHLLIYGPSKAGKSTLAQAIVAMFQGCEYLVIDPMPNKPGESKWGGIDFITLDETGDEYASIKAALDAVRAEDEARRKTMRTHTPPPLVVIIDEALLLVDALGSTKNADGKTEPRFSQFIRQMGASARHRNIKIILLGQGKNLADLGLSSSTARNNYALIRVARNNATNERSAWIEASGSEQAMDIRYVPMLATQAAQRAQVWRAAESTPDADAILAKLMGGAPAALTTAAAETGGWTPEHIRVAAWLATEPSISNREIARRLYPGTDGGGSYSVKAKELRDQVARVTGGGVTPLQNGQNTPESESL